MKGRGRGRGGSPVPRPVPQRYYYGTRHRHGPPSLTPPSLSSVTSVLSPPLATGERADEEAREGGWRKETPTMSLGGGGGGAEEPGRVGECIRRGGVDGPPREGRG